MTPFKKPRIALVSLTLLALLLTACAKVPQNAMDAAQAALAAADSAEAAVYVPDLYQAAQDSMTAAQAEIALQAGEFGPSRSYTRARRLFNATANAATTAAKAVEGRKEQMRTETEALLKNLPATLRTVNNSITRAARSRATRAAADEARKSLEGVNQLLTEAQAALENADLVAAHTTAQQAQAKVQEAQKLLG